jgi:fatty-acyl-CoA synthase
MHGLIMDFQLTIPTILRRAEQLYFDREVVTRRPDRSIHRYTNGEMLSRAKRLAVALQKLGLEDGDRVATFCWNHHQHLEAYVAIPCAGGVLHTLNLRLHENDLTYIASHAGDKIAIVDEVLWELFDKFRVSGGFKHVILVRATDKPLPPGTHDYEQLIAEATNRSSNTWTSTSGTRPRCATPRARPACPRACWPRTGRSSCTRWPAA